MSTARLVRQALGLFVSGVSIAACYVTPAAPSEECRNVEVRRRGDVEVCHKRCGEHGCHEHCDERERWSREHRCWVD